MLTLETQRLWDFLKDQPALSGFILIGGTALAMQIQHRLSEDLDLIACTVKLPRARLDALVKLAHESGFDFVHDDDPGAEEEFIIAGMDLRDYQQDFLVNGAVRLTLFTADSSTSRLLEQQEFSGVRLASLTEIFRLKSVIAADRSKTRDWFDLYILMKRHGFTFEDFHAAFAEGGIESKFDTALARLASGVPQLNDEGFQALLANAPSLTEMRDFFRAEIDRYEIDATERARRGRPR